ncbi:hypothetical protein [Alkaliphilus metalliredigens]|nr:hypothetical protein [Alkaliphilus metalliredigens]
MKYIAPILIIILIAGLIGLYGFGVLFVLDSMNAPLLITIIISIVFVGLIASLGYTLIQRIKEIRKEDDDDLSKY